MTQHCTFSLGDMHFATAAEEIQEVLALRNVTPVPLADEVIAGLINLRGDIVTAVDLRRRLGLQPSTLAEPIGIVVRTADGLVAFIVDRVGGVAEVEMTSLEAAPESVAPEVRSVLRGVCQTEDHLLLVIDTERMVMLEVAPPQL